MKLLRKVIFWCHLLVGTIAGIVILIMSITGVLLTYERQIIAWADTRGYHVTPPATAPPQAARLSVESLLGRMRESQSASPSTVTMRRDPAAPTAFGFAGGRTVFVNPYTGEIYGEGSPRVRAFFRSITEWHRYLGASGESRPTGRAITGACNLAFLFLVMSGFYLWWPRNLTRKQIRNVAWFKRGLAGKARDFNWHNVIGLWSAVPLFIVVLSATVISYPWATSLVYRLVGETPPAAPAPRPAATPSQQSVGGKPARDETQTLTGGLDKLWARAEEQVSGWRSISMQVPTSPSAPVTFTIDTGNGGQPQARAQLTLERATAEVVRWEPFASFTLGRQLRSIMRFAHTGEVVGLLGQTFAGIASLGGAVLVWTGLSLAWRRLRAKVGSRKAEG